jgi:hypothetical protein
MFSSITAQQIIDEVGFLTDNDGYTLFTPAQLCDQINCELTTLWQWAIRCNRDAFTKVTSSFQLGAGVQTISMIAASPGLALADWKAPRGVDVQVGGGSSMANWRKLRLWNFTARDRISRLSYRFLGETLWIMPPDQASQYPLRVWYIFDAPQVSSSALTTPISIPDGADDYVKQGLAARIRVRLDDDPAPHLQQQQDARREVEADLASSKGDQGSIADVSEDGYADSF